MQLQNRCFTHNYKRVRILSFFPIKQQHHTKLTGIITAAFWNVCHSFDWISMLPMASAYRMVSNELLIAIVVIILQKHQCISYDTKNWTIYNVGGASSIEFWVNCSLRQMQRAVHLPKHLNAYLLIQSAVANMVHFLF